MAEVQHVVTGTTAPAAAPPSVAAHYVDTVSGEHYISTGTATAADWGYPVASSMRADVELTDAGTLALSTAVSRVSVYQNTPATGVDFELSLPDIPVGSVMSFTVQSYTTSATNRLIFNRPGGLAYAQGLGTDLGGEFESGELRLAMLQDFGVTVFLSNVAGTGYVLNTITLYGTTPE